MSLSFNVCVIYLEDFHASWHTVLLLILFTCHYVLTFFKSIGEKNKEKKCVHLWRMNLRSRNFTSVPLTSPVTFWQVYLQKSSNTLEIVRRHDRLTVFCTSFSCGWGFKIRVSSFLFLYICVCEHNITSSLSKKS